ncbi:hypothetical protein DASC09_037660 [Saccharomycopsis crataegensis]|uniref:Rho-GAP domain-containing protein n=1 Tax=Saccharomycopsis crataegensis TaxID=43959 RepID=A0AAV5QPA9_9ASCO|nr:hypothetical protein DASC09_037660 [Saccharomycopsis crataegensis]
MHFSNVFWSSDHDYQSQVSNFLGVVDSSVKEVSQTIDYVEKIKQTQLNSSAAISNVVENSYLSKSKNPQTLMAKSPVLDGSQPLLAPKPHDEPSVRSLSANYELHLDNMSDISYSRESLSNQIDAKVLYEIGEFRDVYQTFNRETSKQLNDYLNEYQKLLKLANTRQNTYFNKCKSLEEYQEEPAGETAPITSNATLKPVATFHKRSFSNSSARSSVHGSPEANNTQQQLSPFNQLTRTISNAISRQNSDDEDTSDSSVSEVESDSEFEDDPDNFLEKLEFPMKLGSSQVFRNLNELQDFCKKLYHDASNLERNVIQNKRTSFIPSFSVSNEDQSGEKTVFISNHELGNWLRLNRPSTENSIRNIELYGQSLAVNELIKLSVFKNSFFNNLISNKFQITNEDQEMVYEFTKFFKFVMTFNMEHHEMLKQQKIQCKMQAKMRKKELKHVKREKKVWEEKQHSRVASIELNNNVNNKVPDYIEDLRRSEISTPKNRSRTNTLNVNSIPRSTSNNGIAGYLSSQLKTLSIIASPETVNKKKESLRASINTAEVQYKQTVQDIDVLKRNFEFAFDNSVMNFQSYEKRKSFLIINCLNYLSFLMMKQSEYEHKKFVKLNNLITQSNNQKLIDLELNSILESNSLYYYSPFTSMKFVKNGISLNPSLLAHKYLLSDVNLFGTDVSLLPQYNNANNLMKFSVPIILGEFIDKLYNSFLVNYDDQLNNNVHDSLKSPKIEQFGNEDISNGLLELGNFARNSWTQPFNILEAYNLRQSLIDLYDELQEELIEERKNELNSIGATSTKVQEFQNEVIKKCVAKLFDGAGLGDLISCLKLWLLELPDSLISFVVFEKLKSTYFELYSAMSTWEAENEEQQTEDGGTKFPDDAKFERFDKILKLFNMIPRSNLASLHMVLSHISNVSSMGFSFSGDQQQLETFKLLQEKFINDLINPVSTENNAFPLSHLLLRTSKSKSKTNATASMSSSMPFLSSSISQVSSPVIDGNNSNALRLTNLKVQFFFKYLMKDLLEDAFLTKLEFSIKERETNQQKSLKIKNIKEKESIKSISANNSPSLSRNNVKVFGDSIVGRPRKTSTSTSSNSISQVMMSVPNNYSVSKLNEEVYNSVNGPTGSPVLSRAESVNSNTSSAPTIMVEGLALRSFGTKNRVPKVDSPKVAVTPTFSSEAFEGQKPVNTSIENVSPADGSDLLGSPVISGGTKRARRKSFSLLNNGSGIKLVQPDDNASNQK